MENTWRRLAKVNGGWLATAAAFAVVALIAVIAIANAGEEVTQAQAALLEDALRAAAVNGYATNGQYPALEEIEADYGVVVDREKFHVFYTSFASNIFPDIKVIIKGADE